jgi:uncharacterized membrane protein
MSADENETLLQSFWKSLLDVLVSVLVSAVIVGIFVGIIVLIKMVFPSVNLFMVLVVELTLALSTYAAFIGRRYQVEQTHKKRKKRSRKGQRGN